MNIEQAVREAVEEVGEVYYHSDVEQLVKLVVEKFTSANTGSPKLPTYEEVWKHVAGVCAVSPHKVGCKVAYDFICRQLRAGA